MINEIEGNILEIHGGIIVHGCNAHGVMGSGIAKQIKDQFPHVYDEYRQAYCNHSPRFGRAYFLPLGAVQFVKVDSPLVSNEDLNYPSKFIVNAITQENYGSDGGVYVDYNAIQSAFEQVNEYVLNWNKSEATKHDPLSVNFPMIGCGLAGGDWNIVSKIIDEAVDDSIEKNLYIYNP